MTLPAVGQEPISATEQLDPLVITADLWDSELSKMSASVTLLDEAELQRNGVMHFDQLIDRIPNLTTTGGTSRARYFQIRGIGENSQNEGQTSDSTVRFMLDDLDFTGLGMIGSTFDVKQVEVLRGPQAGAFGANAAGGMIRMVTNAPTPVWTGDTELTVGEDSLFEAGIAVGGPLLKRDPEELMMRFALQHHESNNFRKNRTFDEYTNARDEWTSRLRLLWNPHPDVNVDATIFYANQDNGFDEFALDNNGYYTYSDEPGRDKQDSLAASVRATFDGWEGARVTSITSAGHVDSVYSYDDDWTTAPNPISFVGFTEMERERKTFQQQFRLDSHEGAESLGWIDRWTLGAFFGYVDETTDYDNTSPSRVKTLETDYRAENFALFGQVGHDLDESNRLVLGLRAEHMHLRGFGLSGRDGVADGPAVRPESNDLMFGGKLAFEHDVNDDLMLFASVARGYKSGGINNDSRIDLVGGDPLTYDNETLWNYEIGARTTAFDGRLRANYTAFYLDRSNTQVRDSAGYGGSYRYFTDNGDDAAIYGLEADGSFDLGNDWSIYGSMGLMHSHLDRFTLSNGNAAGGRRLSNTPSYGYSLGLAYQPPEGLFGALELVGKSSYYESMNHTERRGGFNVFNASIGYRKADWSLTLWARNLLNESYDQRIFFFANEDPWIEKRYVSQADPRQVGMTFRYHF